jgi:hypothetical protein
MYAFRMSVEPFFTEVQTDIWMPRFARLPVTALITWRCCCLVYFSYWIFDSWAKYGFWTFYTYFTYWSLTVFCIFQLSSLISTYRGSIQNIKELGLPEKVAIIAFDNCLVTTVIVDLIYWTLLDSFADLLLPEDLPDFSYHLLNLPAIYIECFLNCLHPQWPLNPKRLALFVIYVECYVLWTFIFYASGFLETLPYSFMSLANYSALAWYVGLVVVFLCVFSLVCRLTTLCKRPPVYENCCSRCCFCCPICRIHTSTPALEYTPAIDLTQKTKTFTEGHLNLGS